MGILPWQGAKFDAAPWGGGMIGADLTNEQTLPSYMSPRIGNLPAVACQSVETWAIIRVRLKSSSADIPFDQSVPAQTLLPSSSKARGMVVIAPTATRTIPAVFRCSSVSLLATKSATPAASMARVPTSRSNSGNDTVTVFMSQRLSHAQRCQNGLCARRSLSGIRKVVSSSWKKVSSSSENTVVGDRTMTCVKRPRRWSRRFSQW